MSAKWIFSLIVIVAVGALALASFSKNNKNPITQNIPREAGDSSGGIWESKVNADGEVTVKVTPLELSSKSSEWKFDVGINTHSFELSQNLVDAAVLIDDQGKEYRPINWQGPGPGGHHVERILTFTPIIPAPKSVELKILNVGAPVRSFVWNIAD